MSDLNELLSAFTKCGVITLSSTSTFAKSHALYIISQRLLEEGEHVFYLDLDLEYSSMLSVTGGLEGGRSTSLHLFNPKEDELLKSVVGLASSIPEKEKRGGMVVLDSVNTLQLLLREKDYRTDSLKANHEASILISLLETFAYRGGRTLVLGNLMRLRPVDKAKSTSSELSWEEQLSGGRMIRRKSDAIFSVSLENKLTPEESARLQFKVESVSQRAPRFLELQRNFSVEISPVLLGNHNVVPQS